MYYALTKRLVRLAALLLLFPTVPSAFAQSATISGRVLDEQRHPLPGAVVQLESQLATDVADTEGFYELTNVPPGRHVIRVSYIGYRTEQQTVEVEGGDVRGVDFVLLEDPLGLSEVIVSGSFNPATKLESSTAITTLAPAQIEQRLPRGTSDLLRAVPGVQVTSTYGEIGSDVTVRGLPQTPNSSYRYVSLQEDGLPVFEPPGLLFAFPDAMLRVDETVARMEAVRGGAAAVFSSGTPGGIVNFISKSGGSELEGVLKTTGGNQGMIRQDFNVGGPLAEAWRFNVGGFYRYDRGVRDPGYAAGRGGQVKANVTRDLGAGYVRLYAKYLAEHNVWYMGVPIRNFSDPEPIPGGPPIGRGTTYADDRTVLRIPDAFNPGTFAEHDMRDGYTVRYRMAGLELSHNLGADWNVTLRARALAADNRNNLMIDVADAFPIAAFAAPDLPLEVPRFVRYVNTGEVITDQDAIANLNGNGLMSVFGMAFVDQPVTNYIANVQLARQVAAHNFNLGLYYSTYESRLRLVQEGVFVEVKNQPRLIQVAIPGPDGTPVGLTPDDGFAGYNTGYWNLRNQTDIVAAYAGDTWQVTERLNLDLGVRLDLNRSEGHNERPVVPGRVVDGQVVGQEVPAGYAPFVPTPAQSQAGMFGSGINRTWDYTFSTWGGSVGLNYRLSDAVALYGRGSRGGRVPTSQQWTFQTSDGSQITGETNKGEVETIVQAEVGVKVARPSWSLLLTGFYGSSKNLISNLHRGQADGSFVFIPIPGDTRTIGAEVEAVYNPTRNLRLQLVTALQDPRFTRFSYEFFIPGTNAYSGQQARDYSGNLLNDAVRVLADFTASYRTGGLEAFANVRYTGERMANRPNTITIPAYSEVAAGVAYTYRQVRVSASGINLFDTEAIALMASRTGEDVIRVLPDGSAESIITTGPNAGSTTQNFNTTGQGILPRSLVMSITYRF